jgi:hypothetical protein
VNECALEMQDRKAFIEETFGKNKFLLGDFNWNEPEVLFSIILTS